MKKYIILFISIAVFGCGIVDKLKQKVSDNDKKPQKEETTSNDKTTTNDKSVTSDDTKKKELDLKERELAIKEKELEIQKQQMTNEDKLDQKEKELSTREKDLKDDERLSYNKSHYRSDDLGRYHGDYPEASARYLTYDDIRGKSKWQLKIMRNEIYARYGYIFQTKEMWNYFSNKSWYYPTYYDVNSMLTNVEKSNISYIKRYE